MRKFEYQIKSYSAPLGVEAVAHLNALGADGWKLCGGGAHAWIFIREIDPPEPVHFHLPPNSEVNRVGDVMTIKTGPAPDAVMDGHMIGPPLAKADPPSMHDGHLVAAMYNDAFGVD